MGVSISTKNKDWSRSYGTFGKVRRLLGDAAGISLESVYDYFEKGLWGFWKPDDTVPDDLIYLQSHFDCDGIFMPYTAGKIAARVRRILSEHDFEPEWRKTIVELVEVLEDAAENYEVVMFT